MAEPAMSAIDLYKKGEELGIRYFVVTYTGLNEDLRATLIPLSAIKKTQTVGAGAHPALYYVWPANEPEMYMIPDATTLIQLPWKPTVGWLACNLYMKGQPWNQCPRQALIRQLKRAKEMGYTFKTGVELEFTLLNKEGTDVADPLDKAFLSYQEPASLMRQADFLMEVNDYMEKIGWEPYKIDREAFNGQYEMDFGYSDALTTADRHCFFKYMVKELADIRGMKATFMPQPFQKMIAGTGAHIHFSLWRASDDSNLFKAGSGKTNLSELADHFLGGLLKHAKACTAIVCPTTNSYKRLANASWAPGAISWGGNNRSVLIRTPADDRLEYRQPDGSANPYLVKAALLAVGLDGINNKIDPGTPTVKDLSHDENCEGVEILPKNLLDALRALEADEYIVESLGKELMSSFITLRRRQWDEYMKMVTEWERNLYINC